MTDIPTITFECIGCDHTEEIELEAIDYEHYWTVWRIPSAPEADWRRNEHEQLMCKSCDHEYAELAMRGEPSETLSAAERNPDLIGGS